MPTLNHIAIYTGGSKEYAQRAGISLFEAHQQKLDRVQELLAAAVRQNIPIITFNLLPSKSGDEATYAVIIDSFVRFFERLSKWEFLAEERVKVSVLGKWYDLPNRAVEQVRALIEQTRHHDRHVVNFCLNYSGQDEIVDACRLLAKQVQLGRLSAEAITPELVKENTYNPSLLPPDLIIRGGFGSKLDGFLLWDCPAAHIHFSHKLGPEFGDRDLVQAIEWWKKLQ